MIKQIITTTTLIAAAAAMSNAAVTSGPLLHLDFSEGLLTNSGSWTNTDYILTQNGVTVNTGTQIATISGGNSNGLSFKPYSSTASTWAAQGAFSLTFDMYRTGNFAAWSHSMQISTSNGSGNSLNSYVSLRTSGNANKLTLTRSDGDMGTTGTTIVPITGGANGVEIPQNERTAIALVYDGTTSLSLYIDNVLVANVNDLSAQTLKEITFGRQLTTGGAQGNCTGYNMGNLAFYEGALTADQVSYLSANAGSVIPEPSMFGLLAGLGALALVGSRRRRK